MIWCPIVRSDQSRVAGARLQSAWTPVAPLPVKPVRVAVMPSGKPRVIR